MPWWTFRLLLPGACSLLSFPPTWPRPASVRRIETKRLLPKFLEPVSKKTSHKLIDQKKKIFPKKFLQLLGIPTSQACQQEGAVERPPWRVFISRRKMALLYSIVHQSQNAVLWIVILGYFFWKYVNPRNIIICPITCASLATKKVVFHFEFNPHHRYHFLMSGWIKPILYFWPHKGRSESVC